jgi:predicted dehydrogenase
MTGTSLGVAVVGTGRIGRLHAKLLTGEVSGLRLVAVSDVNADAAATCAARLGTQAVRDAAAEGRLGDLHVVRITSRDPAPPPPEYVRTSGGIFLDMTIHDFDMARVAVAIGLAAWRSVRESRPVRLAEMT